MADRFNKDNDYTKLVDLRLVPIAVVVSTGQAVERQWAIFKATYFPGMSDELARATVLAWAGRNNLTASLHTSYSDKNGSLEVSFVRFTKTS